MGRVKNLAVATVFQDSVMTSKFHPMLALSFNGVD